MDAHLFVAAGGTPFQRNMGLRYAKLARQQLAQGGIGLAFDRGRRQAYPQAMCGHFGQALTAGTGLHVQLQHQIDAVPPVPGWIAGIGLQYQGGNNRKWRTAEAAIHSTASTTSGERSTPPMAGRWRRAGRSRGSVRLMSSPMAGLWWPP